MIVRVTQSFDGYRRGDVFDWSRPVVKLLAARGLVEVIEAEEKRGIESADHRELTEVAMVDNRPRRRRR